MLRTMKSLLCVLSTFHAITGAVVVTAAVYHVDAQSGDDRHTGHTPQQAWRSLDHVNAQVFEPGDKLFFKAGGRWSGQLRPQGSGTLLDGKPVPIMIGKYGEGARPRIEGEGRHLDALLLRNVEFWEVQDLEITNLGTDREPWRTGVRIVTDNFGTMRHIRLRNLFVHDVNGDLSKTREGCGIYFESRGGNQSRFDDLLIENCHLVRTDRNGICQRTSNRTRSTRVVIRGNLLEDIGGDGIKIWGSNGALVEHNVLRGGRMRCDDYAAGIWPFDSDDTIIQFNEVSGMKGIKDGQAFDSDYRCRRSLFQYNYSHNNEGGFFLICAPGNSYNEDTVIRYNISQNDGISSARIFHFGGGPKNTRIYNNTVYVGEHQDLPLLLFTEWDKGNADETYFANNIFYVEGNVRFGWGKTTNTVWGKATNTVFENNIFYGRFSELPADPHALTNRPALVKPGSGANGLDSLTGYQWRSGAAVFHGKLIKDNGGRDFFGVPVWADRPPCAGASEYPR
jgi:hypothetical protein